jgi:hypothetical protein
MNGFVIDRIQTGGAGTLNIPEEKIYELGNFQTVATVRDIPELTFDLESLDVSTEIEAVLTRLNPTSVADGTQIDLTSGKPVNIISPFKSGQNVYTIIRGLGVPYLTLESAAYRFGLRANATQSFSLRGDSIFYVPGTPYLEEYTVAATPIAGPYVFAHPPALLYVENANSLYALAVCLYRVNGTYRRMFFGDDYTNTATGFTLTAAGLASVAAGDKLVAIYGSAVAATYAQTVHETVAVKPAAVRGKDIDVYVGDDAAGTTFTRWSGVQGFEANWRVNLDNDEEFGNDHYVSQDYDTAEVDGTVTLRPRDPQDLWTKIYQVTGVNTAQIVGPGVTTTRPVEVRIFDPGTSTAVKTLYIPDARFTVPAVQGRVQTKLEVTLNWSSDGGILKIIKGARA